MALCIAIASKTIGITEIFIFVNQVLVFFEHLYGSRIGTGVFIGVFFARLIRFNETSGRRPLSYLKCSEIGVEMITVKLRMMSCAKIFSKILDQVTSAAPDCAIAIVHTTIPGSAELDEFRLAYETRVEEAMDVWPKAPSRLDNRKILPKYFEALHIGTERIPPTPNLAPSVMGTTIVGGWYGEGEEPGERAQV